MPETSGAAGKVKVKLVVDSNSKKITKDMKRDLKTVDTSSKTTGKHIGHNLTTGMKTASIAMGNIYAEMARHAARFIADIAKAPVAAFKAGEDQIRQFAGTFATVDIGGTSMNEFLDTGFAIKSELTAMAWTAGVAEEQIFKTFDRLLAQGGVTIKQAQELTKNIAYAGKAVPGGPGALGD